MTSEGFFCYLALYRNKNNEYKCKSTELLKHKSVKTNFQITDVTSMLKDTLFKILMFMF